MKRASSLPARESEFTPKNGYYGSKSIQLHLGKTSDGKIIEDLLPETKNPTEVKRNVSEAPQIIPYQSQAIQEHNRIYKHSTVLKKWHGYIQFIEGDSFTAMLVDANSENLTMEATFSIEEVSEGDRDLVVEGALFDWVIGRERKVHGQIANEDFLVFKRFPMWKKGDLEKKSIKVDEFNEWLSTNSPK